MKKLFIALTTAISLFAGHAYGMDFVCVEPGNIASITVYSTKQEKIICASRSRLGALFVVYKRYEDGEQTITLANCKPLQVEGTSSILSDELTEDLSKEPINYYRAYRFCQSSTQKFDGTPRNQIGTVEIHLDPNRTEPIFLVSKDFFWKEAG